MLRLILNLFFSPGTWQPYVAATPVVGEDGTVLIGPVMRKVDSSGASYRRMTAEEETDQQYWQAIK